MKERPILFNGEMVRAILAGTKTQTRRVIKPQPPSVEAVKARSGGCGFTMRPVRPPHGFPAATWLPTGEVWAVRDLMGREPQWRCPYGVPGDVLWARETHGFVRGSDFISVIYRADGAEHPCEGGELDPVPYDRLAPAALDRWRPSIHMPRWACRLRLRVTDVRVERVQGISEEDALAEGISTLEPDPVAAFADLWDGINLSRGFGWGVNPWVWAVTFERMEES